MLKKIIWISIISLILVSCILWKSMYAGGINAEVYTVSKGQISQYIEDTAQVVSKEKQTLYVEGSGKVTYLNADVGSVVKKGDLLLSLDTQDLNMQLADAEARIDSSKAQLQGTELINYADKIDLAKSSLVKAQVSYDSAKRIYENSKNLYESQAMTKNEFEKVEDEYKAASAALDTASLELKNVEQGTPEYVKDGYTSQLKQAIISRDTILKNIKKQELRAPMDGVIIERLIDKNSSASPSTAAFVIADTKNLELEADILSDDINKIMIGNQVDISGKCLGDTILKGKVVKIAPSAKTIQSDLGINQRRVPITIDIEGTSPSLKPGFNVDIKVITEVHNDIISVPDSSVFDYKGKNQVFIVQDSKALLKEVKKGIESGNSIEITKGLKEGDEILTKPDNSISEGSKIIQVKK